MKCRFLLSLAFLFCTSNLLVEAANPQQKKNPQWDGVPELNLTLTQKAELVKSKQKNNSDHKFKTGSLETALGHDEKLDDGFFNIYGFWGYDHYTAQSIIPTGDFYRFGLDLFYMEKQWDVWGFWFMGGTEFGHHHNATSRQKFKKGAVYSFGLGPSYDVLEDLTLYAGAYFRTHLEDQKQIFPVAGLFWQITSQLSLRTANGAFLTFDAFGDNRLLLEASSEYRHKEYRLKDNAIATTVGRAGQAMTDKGIYTNLGITYKVIQDLWIRGYAGVVSKRKVKAISDGHTISVVEGKTGYVLGAQAGYSF